MRRGDLLGAADRGAHNVLPLRASVLCVCIGTAIATIRRVPDAVALQVERNAIGMQRVRHKDPIRIGSVCAWDTTIFVTAGFDAVFRAFQDITSCLGG